MLTRQRCVWGFELPVKPILPTGTPLRLRNEQPGMGPTVVALRQEHGWTYGVQADQIWAVMDSDDHDTINASFVQPFLSYT